MKKVAVIGTGLSSLFLSYGLIKNGIKPIIFERSNKYINELQNKVRVRPQSYKFYNFQKKSIKGIPKKTHFEDDTIYSEDSSDLKVNSANTFGGFSKVWGGTLNRYSGNDLNDLLKIDREFEKYYEDVEKILYQKNYYVNPSNLNDDIFQNFFGKKMNLLKKKFKNSEKNFFENKDTKLALKINKCVKCNLCLSGCPDNLIFNASDHFEELINDNKIIMNFNHELISVKKNNSGIDLKFKHSSMKFDYVFLCCGPIESSKILINSNDNEFDKFFFRDIQKFITAYYNLNQSYKDENFITLPSIFIQNKSDQIKFYSQISNYNNIFLSKLMLLDGQFFSFMRERMNFFYNRIIFNWTGLDQKNSGSFEISKKNNKFNILFNLNKNTKSTISLIKKKMKHEFKNYNLYQIPLSIREKISEGNHFGSNLPMSNYQDKFHTDKNGCTIYYENLSIVDSSILPSMSNETIALTLMANAYRIGKNFN